MSNGQQNSGGSRSSGRGRLPSIRPIRDLSLGGGTTSISTPSPPSTSSTSTPAASTTGAPSTRPKFAPNLAAAGRRQTPATSEPSSTTSDGQRGRGRGGWQRGARGAGGGRGRGRGRFEPEIIQSRGIFSEGLAESETPANRRPDEDCGGGGGGYSTRKKERADESMERGGGGQRSGNNKSEALETDEQALKYLMKDDFVALHERPDRVKPITLPLKPNREGVDEGSMIVVDKRDTDAMDVDRKPAITDQAKLAAISSSLPKAFREIFGDDKTGGGKLFFVQMPNIMTEILIKSDDTPSSNTTGDARSVKAEAMEIDGHESTPQSNGVLPPSSVKMEPGVEVITDSTTATSSAEDNTEKPSKQQHRHTLANLPRGHIGKLQLLRSGKVRLKLNGANATDPAQPPLIFDANQGTTTAFLQQAVSIKTNADSSMTTDDDNPQGQLCVLGDVSDRLVFTPKIDTLLKNFKKMQR